MYGWIDHEASRQYREEIRQQVAAIRLEKSAREGLEGSFRLVEDTRWELERYAGLLMKRLGNLK